MFREMFPGYRAQNPTTRIQGKWWFVEVENGASPHVQRAFRAKDGYEANLGFALNASPRIYPRFRHKHFAWGEAVSFLVQYQNDITNMVPSNGMLAYEVHGITSDQKHTIRAQFEVRHPGLTGERDYRDDTFLPASPMRRDPDYLLVENCPDSAFQPSIDAMDTMLGSMKAD